MSTWQHRRNILLWTCQECGAITAHPRYKIRTLEIKNTWFATTFPSLHFSIFCQITELSYGPGLMGHVSNGNSAEHVECERSSKLIRILWTIYELSDVVFCVVTPCSCEGGLPVFLRNDGNHLQDFSASQPTRQRVTSSMPWELRISHTKGLFLKGLKNIQKACKQANPLKIIYSLKL
jgi:hypothetical protein